MKYVNPEQMMKQLNNELSNIRMTQTSLQAVIRDLEEQAKEVSRRKELLLEEMLKEL